MVIKGMQSNYEMYSKKKWMDRFKISACVYKEGIIFVPLLR